MRRAVFLDRDGVINKIILKDNKAFSPRRFEEFEFIDGIREVLGKFRKEGFVNIVVTNQPDIERGLMDRATLEKIHNCVRDNLPVDDICVCPHDDVNNCQCRKPKPGMLFEAAKKWNIKLKSSFLVGDRWKDVAAGKEAGCVTILIDYPYNKKVEPDFRVNDLNSAATVILNTEKYGQ